ncbi:hypothetical protein [Staphylococcus xylosus]
MNAKLMRINGKVINKFGINGIYYNPGESTESENEISAHQHNIGWVIASHFTELDKELSEDDILFKVFTDNKEDNEAFDVYHLFSGEKAYEYYLNKVTDMVDVIKSRNSKVKTYSTQYDRHAKAHAKFVDPKIKSIVYTLSSYDKSFAVTNKDLKSNKSISEIRNLLESLI